MCVGVTSLKKRKFNADQSLGCNKAAIERAIQRRGGRRGGEKECSKRSNRRSKEEEGKNLQLELVKIRKNMSKRVC